jgi:hypothetical protein
LLFLQEFKNIAGEEQFILHLEIILADESITISGKYATRLRTLEKNEFHLIFAARESLNVDPCLGFERFLDPVTNGSKRRIYW